MPQQPTFLPFFHFNNFLLHFSKTKQIEIWLKQTELKPFFKKSILGYTKITGLHPNLFIFERIHTNMCNNKRNNFWICIMICTPISYRVSLCLEFLLTVGYQLWIRPPKINAGKSKVQVLKSNLSK